MKIVSFNVNSIRARARIVRDFLARVRPDVLAMQETKVVDDEFPTEEFTRLGYTVAFAGQRTYNGVAIASRLPMSDVRVGLFDDGADVGGQPPADHSLRPGRLGAVNGSARGSDGHDLGQRSCCVPEETQASSFRAPGHKHR